MAESQCIIQSVEVKFTQSTRKHRVGRAHVFYVLETVEPSITPATEDTNERREWIGPDERGVELEIIGVVEPNYLLIIHVMPLHYRRKTH